MDTATRLKLGPADHNMPLTWDEYQTADYRPGFRYELIHGRLYVSPAAQLPHDRNVQFIDRKLYDYSKDHSEVTNMVTTGAEVHVPLDDTDEEAITCPRPDVAAYKNVPKRRDLRWQDINPFLVVEVLSPDNIEKDLGRNLILYHRGPTIKEYWVIDGITDPDRPSMIVYRRWGQKWQKIVVPFDTIYTTRILPGFELHMNPWA